VAFALRVLLGCFPCSSASYCKRCDHDAAHTASDGANCAKRANRAGCANRPSSVKSAFLGVPFQDCRLDEKIGRRVAAEWARRTYSGRTTGNGQLAMGNEWVIGNTCSRPFDSDVRQ
jgi:hypothetical protein